ncbi:MAG: hypothetical protein P4L31_07975 [Candidatus Babeliales bacterium]|nr:hypothetical protein [Candidatus Babeliales bacterium]
MKRIIHSMLWSLSLLFCMNSFSYIYEVRVLRKWDDARKRFHYFIGLSDFHDKIDPSNQIQLKKIQDILAKLDKNTAKISIEDLSSVNNSGKASCGSYMVNSRGGILGGLAQTTREMGLDVANIEFRYCRVIALGPVLNNLKDDLNSFPSVTSTNMNVLIDEIKNEIADIKAQNYSPKLKKRYDASIKTVEDQLVKLHMHESGSLSVAQYLDKYSTASNRLEFLKNLLTFDSALLDLRLAQMAHDGFNKRDKDVSIAGGAHIGRTCDLLQIDGYQDVSTTKISYGREHDLQKCLGSNIIDGAFCVKPQPISLDFIDTIFLNKE